MRDITYPPIIVAAKLGFKALGLRFDMRGTEHVPREGGALLALNHVSYVDFILGGYAAHPRSAASTSPTRWSSSSARGARCSFGTL